MAVKRNAKKRYGKFIFCRAVFSPAYKTEIAGRGTGGEI